MNLIDAFTAAKAAYDLATVAIQARDDVKIQSAMADLRERMWDMSATGLTQVQALHMLELETQKLRMQLTDAERAKAELEAKLEEETKYQITEIRPGVWAYCLVDHVNAPVEQRPNFCAACYSNGKKVPLRYFEALGARLESFQCSVDDSHTYRNRDAGFNKALRRSSHWAG